MGLQVTELKMVYSQNWSAIGFGYCVDGNVSYSGAAPSSQDLSDLSDAFKSADQKYMFGNATIKKGTCTDNGFSNVAMSFDNSNGNVDLPGFGKLSWTSNDKIYQA